MITVNYKLPTKTTCNYYTRPKNTIIRQNPLCISTSKLNLDKKISIVSKQPNLTLSLKKHNGMHTSKSTFNDQHDYWAVYISHLSSFITDNSRQLFYIQKCLNCSFAKPNFIAVQNYKVLLEKINLKKDLNFNDFYFVIKHFPIHVLKYVTASEL